MTVDWRQVEALDRVNIGMHGLEQSQPDVVAHLALRARLDEVGQTAPALAVASTVVATFNCPVVPLHKRTLEPVGEALATLDALCDWYSERPTDAAGVTTGPRGSWTLVGVHAESWQQWLQGWLLPLIGVTGEYQDGDGLTKERKDLRPYGRVAYIPWQAPEQTSAWTSGVLRGSDLGYRQARELLVERERANDAGGWGLLSVLPDDRGRLAKFTGKRLAEGVQVLADNATVPVYATRRGGWTLNLTGFPDTAPETVAPPWFASTLGAKY